MQQKDILQGYEIRNWELGPRTYKILAASTILTILPLFLLGQTNLMSASACSSPFVSRVCQVLDTVYVGAKILAKDSGYVEQDYKDLQLQESNEVIWTNETNIEPPLNYPGGYFEVANRDELAALAALNSTNPASAYLNNTPAIIPPANNTPIAPPPSRINPPLARGRTRSFGTRSNNNAGSSSNPIDDMLAGASDPDTPDTSETPATATTKNPVKTPNPVASNSPENPLDKSTARTEGPLEKDKINTKPLYDFADIVLQLVIANQVDLTKEFVVTMDGVVKEDGMLDEELSKFGASQGDQKMVELGQQAIMKVGVSGWLKYLNDEGANRLKITFGQNAEALMAEVISDLKDPNKAKKSASGLRGLISAALIAHNSGIKKLKDDEVVLLRAAKVTNEGRLLKITFNLEKPVAQKIIDSRLAEYKKKKEDEAKKKAVGANPSSQVEKESAGSRSAL